MVVPLSFLRAEATQQSESLGDCLSKKLEKSHVTTLLDCISRTGSPALLSPDPSRTPLCHNAVHDFLLDFVLPTRSPLGPNDRVLVVLPTGPSAALALLAIACYHTCAPVNVNCTPQELSEDAHRLGTKAIITTTDAAHRLHMHKLAQELDCDIIYLQCRTSGPAGLFDLSGSSIISSRYPSRPHHLNDQSLVLHTSGTSGKKKVVPYTLRSLIVGTCCVIQSWDLQPNDVNMNMMPLFHVGGIVRNLLAPVFSGGSAIMCAGFDPIAFWTLAQKLRATWYYAAPTIHHAILGSQPDHIDVARDLSIRMICNAAGGLLPSLAVALQERFCGAVVLPSYGMTECMPITTPPIDYKLDRPGCSGVACGPYISIRNPLNLEVPCSTGAVGAVCVRGLPTFQGYEVSPDISVPLDTSAFTSEGWFDSGDCGYLDTDGYLYITGRSKEIINKGGEVISPFEIEDAISTAAKGYVKNTLAFAIDHDALQEVIGVVVVPVPGRPRIGLALLHELLRAYLHPSKWPFAIVYMDDLPKNSAGKPLRIKLSERLGISQLSDDIPPISRHFEAQVPRPTAPLSEPISCSQVTVDLNTVEYVITKATGAYEVIVRHRLDGHLEGFLSVPQDYDFTLNLKKSLTNVLPGYCIPDTLHTVSRPLARGDDGEYDFLAMEKEIARLNTSDLSSIAIQVRDIMADILLVDASAITGDSDFFLLGGNSLLLGKLTHQIRRQTGADLTVTSVFSNPTVNGIAALVQASLPDDQEKQSSYFDDDSTINDSVTLNESRSSRSRGQNHPFVLLVQAIPFLFFYPLKAALTWTFLVYILAAFAPLIGKGYWARIGALLCAIFAARLIARIVCPLIAIGFKWVVIGRYRPGKYRMWSNYYLRWWIVNQALRSSGRGVFAINATTQRLYFRLLGARVGKKVHIHSDAKLGEFDLLTLHDGCRIDSSLVRGFCVEQEGFFRLDNVTIGPGAVVNTYTQIAPGAMLAKNSVYGPHASSYEAPSSPTYAAYNRTSFAQPSLGLKVFVAWPIILLVILGSYVPWFFSIWLMIHHTFIDTQGKNALEATIYWFASPTRIGFHVLSRIIRATVMPILHVILAIVVKRMLGLNRQCESNKYTQLVLLRRYINSILLSKERLNQAFALLGTHYEAVSVVYRAMGAKVGRRVYWPGSGIVCDDPELLEIGDDVVFGSRSEFFTTDKWGTGGISIGDGAMIADRVVLLPNTYIGRQTVMGSGALGKRDGVYPDGSSWMGRESGEAVCLNQGKEADLRADTTTPFGRAFYNRRASYFVFPYWLILLTNLLVTAITAAYWSVSAVGAAQILRQLHIGVHHLRLFRPCWYRCAVLYGLIASCFIIILTVQAILCLLWVVATKWILIGRRKPGVYEWDNSSYCQRWQLHLVFSRGMFKGYSNGGVIAPLTGTAYIVWFLKAQGAKIGKNCALYPGGKAGLCTEPDLVELGDNVSLDACSIVAHINSRGQFALNTLKIGNGCAMRSGSRLLSGAAMEDGSMLCEHTLLASGEIADAGAVYVGWPGRRVNYTSFSKYQTDIVRSSISCSVCQSFQKKMIIMNCGHLFCSNCVPASSGPQRACSACLQPPKHINSLKALPV